MSLKLRLTASEYNQLKDPEDPKKGTVRYRRGDEFEAHDQEEYDRLTAPPRRGRGSTAAVAADSPDPDDPAALKGDDLQAALQFYGLETDGRADEKRKRIAAHLEANPDAERYQPAA